MTNEEIENIIASIEVAKLIQREIESAEYFISLLSTRLLNRNVDFNVTKNVLTKMATSSQKDNIDYLLKEINVTEIENEMFDKVIQKLREKKAALETELAEYEIS